MRDSKAVSNQNMGVLLPRKPNGRANRELKSEWMAVIEQLMAQGVQRPSHMAQKTGLTFHTAKRWMAEVHEKWLSTLTEEEKNFRRELLYQEAESLARDAWVTALDSKNACVVVGALKTILEANARRADLVIPKSRKQR
jgi:hypothetical protein